MSQDIRWLQRFENFKKALKKLAGVANDRDFESLSELEIEGLIQRFEYTYELAWKTLQDLLRAKGYDIAGPSPVIEQAFQDGYIKDGENWKKMKKSRELTSHVYDESTAMEIAKDTVKIYYPLFCELEKRLAQEHSSSQTSLFD